MRIPFTFSLKLSSGQQIIKGMWLMWAWTLRPAVAPLSAIIPDCGWLSREKAIFFRSLNPLLW